MTLLTRTLKLTLMDLLPPKEKSVKFPILSRIAKDILAIPASTIASESAFSAGRRVLDEKRSRLAPHSIQICVCKKDWDQAEIRTQGLRNDDDGYICIIVRRRVSGSI